MCFFQKQQAPVVQTTTAPTAPRRDPNSMLGKFARATLLRARGAADTIASSPLGDPNFGKSVSKPTLLGQTAGY